MRGPPSLGPLAIGGIALIPIAVLFLLGGHFAHLAGILLWLLLIVCPQMHILLRRRHQSRHWRGSRRILDRARREDQIDV